MSLFSPWHDLDKLPERASSRSVRPDALLCPPLVRALLDAETINLASTGAIITSLCGARHTG